MEDFCMKFKYNTCKSIFRNYESLRSHAYSLTRLTPLRLFELVKFAMAGEKNNCNSQLVTCDLQFKRVAFTLAETLITIGIIGVVSAITIPALITNYQKNQTVVQLKKTYNDIQNGLKLSIADNGDISGWTLPNSGYDPSGTQIYVKSYWIPYFKGSKLCNTQKYKAYTSGGRNIASQFAGCMLLFDGRILYFNRGVRFFWIIADINGESGPNKFGRDIFVFDLDAYYIFYNRNNLYKEGQLYFWGDDGRNGNGGGVASTQQLLTNGQYGCGKNIKGDYGGYFCGEIIRRNNWKIPKDYPW